MKRRILVIASGAFFFVALLWTIVIAEHLLEIPTDFSFSAQVASEDNFYDAERGTYSGAQFSKTDYFYEALVEENEILSVRNVFHVRTSEDETIVKLERLYAIDRYTGKHVPGGDKDREGYLFVPRNLKPNEEFTYWHINYDAPARMVYQGEEVLYGTKVFKYEADYSEQSIDQTSNLTFLPGVGDTRGVVLEPTLTLWVEPLTGTLVKYSDDTVAYFYNLETLEREHPWNHFSNTFYDASVQENALLAERERVRTFIVLYYTPSFFVFIGLLLLLLFFRLQNQMYAFLEKRFIQQIFGFFFVLLGALALVGWVLDIPILVRPVSLAAAMNPVTAVCFIALGIVLFSKNIRSIVSLFAGLVIMLVAGLRIVGELFGLPYPVDLIFFGEKVLEFPAPARMALYTAVSFFLLGVAILGNAKKELQKVFFCELISLTVLVLSLFSGSNFFIDSAQIIELPIFFSSSIVTVLLFVIGSGLLVLQFNRQRKESFFESNLVTISILVLLILITVFFMSASEQTFTSQAETSFLNEVDEVTQSISDRVDVYVNTLVGTRGLFQASDAVNRDEFKAYVDALELEHNYPGVQAIGYAVFVAPEEKESHIASIQAEGFPEYTIRPTDNRPVYSSIIFIEPFDIRNREAFGFDMYSNEIRRTAMDQARDANEARMSGRITLVQEIDDDVQPGFLIYVPYYENGTPVETARDRENNIIGFVYSAFRANNFFEGILGTQREGGVGLHVSDGLVDNANQRLFDNTGEHNITTTNARFIETRTIYVSGRPWTLTFISTERFGVTPFSQVVPLIVILLGVLVSVLVTTVLHTSLSSRQRAINYAKEVTQDLSTSKDALEKANKEISEKLSDLERINKVMVDRELKMIELKEKIKKHTS